MELLNAILTTDAWFFKMFNSQLGNPILDIIMPAITDLHQNRILVMYILPVFLVLWLVWHRLKCVKTLLGVIVAVALSDTLCYHGIKNLVHRERPEQTVKEVILRTHSHSGWSFPSNHASNVMAAAFVVRYIYPNLRSFVYILALLIGYSRIYVGVHFPLDVFFGAAFGWLCGFFTIFMGNSIQPESWKYDPLGFAKGADEKNPPRIKNV